MEDDLYPMSSIYFMAGELGIDFLKINDFPFTKIMYEKSIHPVDQRFCNQG